MTDRVSFAVLGDHHLLDQLGLTAESVFTDPRIQVWRSLPDRENATLDYVLNDGSKGRLHVKRYPPQSASMARRELQGFFLLTESNVPAAPIIATGARAHGDSFIILKDLAGYIPADKLLQQGFEFDRLLTVTADLAAMLHNAGLHHRDLYLCHFMIKPNADSVAAKLIDMARVARLTSVFTRRRWIVKDLAQFWYSTLSLPITDQQRIQWLSRYAHMRKIPSDRLLHSIQRKAAAIARHDIALRKKQPGRNVSIAS